MFFSFDGVDGVGKSTQIRLFCEWLERQSHRFMQCRDPGGTPLGEAVRRILLHGEDLPIASRAEMLLYMASRAQLVDEVIRPALAAEAIVVSDRYLLANVVYQGYAGGLPPELVWRVGEIATGGVAPDRVFVLDMPADLAAERIGQSPDRMESRGLDYLRSVRQGFLTEAEQQPDRISVIDASGTPEEVHAAICKVAHPMLRG